jgi:hypothetical protein
MIARFGARVAARIAQRVDIVERASYHAYARAALSARVHPEKIADEKFA